jgi:transcription elongation factor GreA
VEADAASGRLSFDSPVGKALRGARAGESVQVTTPRGTRTLEITAVG